MHKVITKREKRILYLAIAVIIASVVYNFSLSPLLAEFETISRDITMTRAKIKKYLRLLSQKNAIETKFNDLTSQMREYKVTQNDALVNTLSGIESLAKDADVKIIDIRPQTQSAKPVHKEIIIEVKSEGTMEGFLKLAYNIENSILLLRIKKFQLTSKGNMQNLEGVFMVSAPASLE